MKEIVIDIVLVPEEAVKKRIYAYNSNLVCEDKNQIILSDKVVPHVSLRMMLIEDSMLDDIAKEVSKIDPIHLTMDKIFNIRGKNYLTWWGKFTEEKLLVDLHIKVMKIKTKLQNEDAKSGHFSGKEINAQTVNYVKGFEKTSERNFQPHITLGRGEQENRMKLPLEGKYYPAIYQLGNNCTCVDELYIKE